MSKPESVAVFCASSQPQQDSWADRARSFGVRLAQEGISLVYGGGARGLMGQVAQGCHEAGGRVTGVLPTIFDRPDVRLKVVHSELEIVPGMHERKARMYELADAFVVLPGGIGTFEEFFEVYTWRQIGLHRKNIVLWNMDGFYTPLLSFLDSVVEAGLMGHEVRDSLLVADDEDDVIRLLGQEVAELPDKLSGRK